MKPLNTYILCGFPLILLSIAGTAQPAFEFASGTGPAGNGSATANQVVTFQQNALNPVTGTYIPMAPAVTATFSISNQQYVLPATQNPSGADVSFGANVNGGGKTPSPAALYTPMNTISSPQAPQFSSTQDNIGAGMSMTSNYAVALFTSAMGLYNANSPTNGTYYMADLTITFSAPITDPVLQIVGFGGTFGALGMTSSLTLTTAGVTLSKLSGSPEFGVTPTTIVNTSATPTSTTAAGAASGSVLVTGNSVTTLKFQIYLRGDGKTPTWSNATSHTGDAWLIAVSGLNTFVALPVGITDFIAEPHHETAALQWATTTQLSSKEFAVQRSADGVVWGNIGLVAAAGSRENSVQYNFVDELPLTGTNYYRIEEIDDNGTSGYSSIRNVDFAGASAMPAISWYPNPTHDRVMVATGSAQTATGSTPTTTGSAFRSVTLTTIDGRILQSITGFTSGQSVDLSRYPYGIYFLIVRTADNQTHVARIERN